MPVADPERIGRYRIEARSASAGWGRFPEEESLRRAVAVYIAMELVEGQ